MTTAPTAEQGSIEWLMERCGHCTASRFRDVMDILKSGKPGAKRETYKMELVVERLTERPYDHYVTKAMQDGIEREPAAKMAYEAATGTLLTETGFLHHTEHKFVGGSPDALIDDDGIAEFKAPTASTHLRTLLEGMNAEHQPQIQGLLWITGRKYCDFCSYHPEFPARLQTHIQRIERDDDYIAELAGNVLVFLQEVQELCDKLKG